MENLKRLPRQKGRTRGGAEPHGKDQVPGVGENRQAAPSGSCGGVPGTTAANYRVNIWAHPEPNKSIGITLNAPHCVVLLPEGVGPQARLFAATVRSTNCFSAA